MKKVIFSIFIIISLNSYSSVKEIVTSSTGEKIILMNDHTWETQEKYNSISNLEKYVTLSNIKMSPKRSDGRTLSATITNKNRKTLKFVTYKIKWFFDNEYSTIRTFTIKNLKYRESINFTKRIKLEGISEKDYHIEVVDFEFSK